jgi:hypothetical protein
MLPAGRLEAIDRVVGRPVRLALHVMAGQARDEIVERRKVRRVVDVAQLFPHSDRSCGLEICPRHGKTYRVESPRLEPATLLVGITVARGVAAKFRGERTEFAAMMKGVRRQALDCWWTP